MKYYLTQDPYHKTTFKVFYEGYDAILSMVVWRRVIIFKCDAYSTHTCETSKEWIQRYTVFTSDDLEEIKARLVLECV